MPSAPPDKIVDFSHPPVIEVVAGIWFEEIENFNSTDFGILWESFKEDYPHTEDQIPLPGPGNLRLNFLPEFRRVWFSNRNSNETIQIQNNLFIVNWGRPSPDVPYKGYTAIKKSFCKNLEKFIRYINEKKASKIYVKRLELKYVNLIALEHTSKLSDLDNIFHVTNFKKIQNQFLSDPTYSNVTLSFPMKKGNDPKDEGEFRFILNSGFKNTSYLVQWEMIAERIFHGRGEFSADSLAWFDLAREWIVKGFGDLTSEEARKKWGQKNVGT